MLNLLRKDVLKERLDVHVVKLLNTIAAANGL